VSAIQVETEILLSLLTEVGRSRALADHETDLIEAIVYRSTRTTAMRIKWTPQLDNELWRTSKKRGGVKRFAIEHGFPPRRVYQRLCRIKKQRAAKVKLKASGESGKFAQ
jgi:hypothetical protein